MKMNSISTIINTQLLKFSRQAALAVLLLLSGYPALCQKEISLEQCIQIALEQNIGIKRQALQVDLAEGALKSTWAGRLPGIDGFYSHYINSGKTVNYENYSYINTNYQDGNLGIEGSLPLYSGFSNWYQIRSDKFNLKSEAEKKEELKKTVTMEVTAAYLQILFAEELLGIAESKLAASQEQLRMNEGFYKVGRISRVEVVDMKSQVAQDNLAKIQAENELRTAYLNLAMILNMDNEKDLKIKKPTQMQESLSLVLNDPEQINDYAQANHPGVHSAELFVNSRVAQLDATKALYSPKISLNGLIYSRYSELGVDALNPTAIYLTPIKSRDNMYKRASVNVSLPIFSQLQLRNKINQAKIQATDARLMLDQKKITIRQDIQKAYAAACNAKAKYEASQDAVASATESFTMTREKYKAGIASSIDFKVAQNQLLQSQSVQIQSKYEYLIRIKILDLYLDKPITLE